MISRKRLLDVLLTALYEYNTNNKNKPIEMHFNSYIDKITINKDTQNLEIYVNINNNIHMYTPDLLLGGDGAYSIVRKWLLENPVSGTESENGPKPVLLKELRSPSTGLNFKMLRIKSPFVIPDKNNTITRGATDVDTANTTNTSNSNTPTTTPSMLSKDDDLYIFESAGKTSYERFRAVLFPQKHIEGIHECAVYLVICSVCILGIMYAVHNLYYVYSHALFACMCIICSSMHLPAVLYTIH